MNYDAVLVPSDSTAPEVGMNRPLLIRVTDVFTGDHDAGEVLLTTAARSAASFDAQPLAIQAIHRLPPKAIHLPFRAAEPGSPIVYYTPAALDRELSIDVRMDFDSFDKDRYDHYVDVIGRAVQLPVFIGLSALGGIGGAAGAAAAVYATSTGIKVLLRALDRWRDGTNEADLNATFSVNLEVPGEIPSSSGYYLCWNDQEPFLLSPDGSWSADSVVAGSRGDEFGVDGQGHLVYRDTDDRVDDTPNGYVLLHISGTEDGRLAQFQPTAASAALLAKFTGRDGGIVDDVAELAEAYNDFVFLNRIAAIDRKIARSKGGQEDLLRQERTATLQHIQSRDVRDLLEAQVETA